MLGKFSTIVASKIFNYSCFKNFLIPFLFLFFFRDSYNLNVGLFDIVSGVSETISFFFFTLFCSSEVISTILSSSSLIRSSASDILLLSPRVFLTSVIVLFVSVCLFFNSSMPLLIDCYIFSILFSRFLIIFAIIILNSFQLIPLHLFGRLCF